MVPRRAWLDDLAWDEQLPGDAVTARRVWTQTAFSEYASAAAFAAIASALLACGAPIELVAAAGDFVIDELVHVEAAARVAAALGGAVTLDVDLARLVRPVATTDALVQAIELVVRVACVGEAITVPLLKLARTHAGSPLIASVLARIVADESGHAQLGWWVLDWASPRLDDAARAHLGAVAGAAVRAFAPTLQSGGATTTCEPSALGVLGCEVYDPAFAAAVRRHVATPLACRGIAIPRADLEAVGVVA